MIEKYAFKHNGEWHFSAEPEKNAKLRHEKWEFLRTHEIKHFYVTNEKFQQTRDILINQGIANENI